MTSELFAYRPVGDADEVSPRRQSTDQLSAHQNVDGATGRTFRQFAANASPATLRRQIEVVAGY